MSGVSEKSRSLSTHRRCPGQLAASAPVAALSARLIAATEFGASAMLLAVAAGLRLVTDDDR